MVDQSQKKTLSLKPVPDKADAGQEPAVKPTLKRPAKRVIRRDALAKTALGRTKTGQKKTANKSSRKKAAPVQKKTQLSPSELRLLALDKQLDEIFPVWSQCQPLAIGIEKSLFCFIAEHRISASKRVVQKLLRRHTSTRPYQDNILHHAQRYDLDGSPAGQISQWEKDHAQRQIDVVHSACTD